MFKKNRLPQYFYGDESNEYDKSHQDENNPSQTEDFHFSEPNLSRIPSPASSLASTKKLEWDSGADIGYIYDSFKHSRKSKSFPTLNLSSIPSMDKSLEIQEQEIPLETKIVLEVHKKDHFNSQSTSSENSSTKHFMHSTPYDHKSILKKSDKNLTKNIDECLQTTVINTSSKGIQTDDRLPNTEPIKPMFVNKSLQTDTIRSSGNSTSDSGSFQYIPGSNFISESTSTNENNFDRLNYISSEKTDSSSRRSSVQAAIFCNIHHQHSNDSVIITPDNSKSKSNSLKSKSNSSKSKSNSLKSKSTDTSTDSNSPLGKLISTQQSAHLIEDIDKSLKILQKFIKSKNYSFDTKKHYARKIVTKIIESKYIDDTSSSNAKTSTSAISKISFNDQSNMNKKYASLEIKNQLENNETTPTSTAHTTENKSIRSIKIDTPQTEQYKPTKSKENSDVQCENQCKEINKKSELIHELNQYKIKDSTSRSDSHSDLHLDLKSWRDNKTLSEKLFEARKTYSSRSILNTNSTQSTFEVDKRDNLIQYSKRERKRQLLWINNEISYLRKLQDLLQVQDPSVTSNSHSAVEEEDIPISKHSSKSQSLKNLTDKSLTDIESKFNKEFGIEPATSHKSAKSSAKSADSSLNSIKNLSSYLTNEQIKFLIDHDAKNIHCQTCVSCKHMKPIDEGVENKSSETSIVTKKSPKTNINELLVNSPVTTRKETFRTADETITTDTPYLDTMDASIQCTLEKKKEAPSTRNTTSTEYSQCSSNSNTQQEKIGPHTQVFYENMRNFRNSDTTTQKYSSSEYEKSNNIRKSPKKGKENKFERRKPVISRRERQETQQKILKSSLAYFLTFEEDSQNELDTARKNKLKHVIVKIPKFSAHRNYDHEIEHSGDECTLQDYLHKNRPSFVRTAEWRRNKFLWNAPGQKPRNIFTCKQIREITSKQYNKLPEVQNKIKTHKTENERRHNRCKANVFSKKLQKKTLGGEISLATCVSVMTSE